MSWPSLKHAAVPPFSITGTFSIHRTWLVDRFLAETLRLAHWGLPADPLVWVAAGNALAAQQFTSAQIAKFP